MDAAASTTKIAETPACPPIPSAALKASAPTMPADGSVRDRGLSQFGHSDGVGSTFELLTP